MPHRSKIVWRRAQAGSRLDPRVRSVFQAVQPARLLLPAAGVHGLDESSLAASSAAADAGSVGASDPLAPPMNGRILSFLIPKAQLRLIDDGHLFFITSANEVALIVREFLRAPDRAD